ncbi:PREDICTED: serine protease 55 [Chrysochloris asiatica]|uniref:Serine protease 55 n=1 Tax=Chrysochloris asiatica TaxID=185453 RepID=A0A9B0TPE5_CHRAS|nr:PREDICTED: serine protease 55 [Chrysochloris asiatica]
MVVGLKSLTATPFRDFSALSMQPLDLPRCGERPIFEGGAQHSRIIEGVEAGFGEFPWMVSIQLGNEHFCGGTILNKWWILTAAHCFHYEQLSPADLNIVAGTNDLISPHKEIKEVTKIILHKDFEKVNMNNDVALLLLGSPITFTDEKLPICLPRQPIPSTWHECWVAGWGQTSSDNKYSMTTDLMKVPMIILDWEECSKKFSKLTENMLCAGYKNESYDACQGDSGGPLVCTPGPGKKWYQVGIISWGKSCGLKNVPGIYTLLANYDLWIKNVTEVEGRPFNAEEMRAPPKQKQMRSQAAEFPESRSPTFWFLLCLLLHMIL